MAPLALIFVAIAVALVFDFLNGFHDAANSIATIVSTRVLTPAQAVLWAAFFNFVAAFVFGTGVASTISSKLIDTAQVDVYVILAALIGAITWNIITWLLALPTSSSHALLAGYAGAAIAKARTFGVIKVAGWVPIITWIVKAPIVGLVLGMALMTAVSWIFRRSSPHRVDALFRRLQLVSAGVYSLAHGTNDAQKTMGIIAVLLVSAHHPGWATWGHLPHMLGHEDPTRPAPIGAPIILACHAAMALGTVFGGWRIVKTMGSGITRLQPVGGFCAEAAAATTIIYASVARVPLSTTHAITGAILGVGSTRSIRGVRWIWGQRIVVAWVITLPCSAIIAALSYLAVHHLVEPFFPVVK